VSPRFFDGSPGIEQRRAWRVGQDLLMAESLGPQLHRPDQVQAALSLALKSGMDLGLC
jgi:hypothetical protein